MIWILSFFALSMIIFTMLAVAPLSPWWARICHYAQLHMAVAMIFIFIISLFIIRQWDFFHFFVFGLQIPGAILNFWPLYPFTPFHALETPDAPPEAHPAAFTLLSCNVKMDNRDYDKLIHLVKKQQPDILLLMEVDEFWDIGMREIENQYPYRTQIPQPNTYGMNLYSRLPLHKTEIKHLQWPDVPSIFTEVELRNGARFLLVGLHPKPPAPEVDAVKKDIEVLMAGEIVKNQDLPALMTGDLNDVGWSRVSRKLKEHAKVTDPRIGRRFLHTYNAYIPIFRYPIDHFFCSEHFAVKTLKRLDKIGSDHFPVMLEAVLQEKKSQTETS